MSVPPQNPRSARTTVQQPREIVYLDSPPKKSVVELIDRPVTLLLIILSFAGGILMKGFNIAGNVVTQDQFTKVIAEFKASNDEMKKYVEVKSQESLDKGERYSDSNRLQTLNDMKTATAALQSKVDSVAVKQDLMFDAMRQMQQNQQAISDRRK